MRAVFVVTLRRFFVHKAPYPAGEHMKKQRLTTIIAATWFLYGLVPTALAESSKPNIVYILADDLGYGDVQCLNPKRGKIKTPCLDKLASQGMTFTDAHSGSSVCTPTRYGLLTGRYAWRTRLQNGVLDDYDEPLIAVDRLTVPRLLKDNGYHTPSSASGILALRSTLNRQSRAANRRPRGRAMEHRWAR